MPLLPSLPFALTIFASAFLLFLVQPIVAKQILPWFGGAASVWTVCMVFFQAVLLGGYAYADLLVRRATPRRQALVHGALLLASVLTLPIVADGRWQPGPDSAPSLLILGLLLATVGLPYFVLSSTGPLLQAWVARAPWAARVYRLFSLSNAASLLALLVYPVTLELWLPLRAQAQVWSAAYAGFALLCGVCAWQALQLAGAAPSTGPRAPAAAAEPAPARATQVLWLALPAMGSWLLLAVTNEITQNVASIPFLWIVPLSVYLLSFIVCFESDRWYRRGLWLPLGAAALALSALELAGALDTGWREAVVLHVGALFVLCVVLHGETARRRPAPGHLTRFYLMLSAGGALGGAAVGLGAPALLPSTYELGLGLTLTAALGLAIAGRRALPRVTAVALTIACGAALVQQVRHELEDVRVVERNFYGTLRTYDIPSDDEREAHRVLLHGGVKHGEQMLSPARRREPTTYYGHSAGIGRVLDARQTGRPSRVGLVGLGAGTLAAYARPGDVFRLYEIDPQVFALARREFSFLADSAAARIDDVPGDARLSMEREAPQGYDVLAIDAFSGGSVPMHLITREAVRVYLRHLAPGGVLAFHLTNRHLDLPPVVAEIARAEGLQSRLVHDEAEGSELRHTDWVLVAREAATLQPFDAWARPIPSESGRRPWSDDFNNLLSVLK